MEKPVPAKKSRKKTGKLAALPEMPLDILYEVLGCSCSCWTRGLTTRERDQIFGHMCPYDILRLSRTTKAFRRVLMSRSSRSIWTQAFLAIPGLPPCPSWITEPQYAQLAFDNYCYASCTSVWHSRAC